ncbi:hypothetical protein Tco_0735487 [Tanacetum coccineum]
MYKGTVKKIYSVVMVTVVLRLEKHSCSSVCSGQHTVAIASSQKNKGSLEAEIIVRATSTRVRFRLSTMPFCSGVRGVEVLMLYVLLSLKTDLVSCLRTQLPPASAYDDDDDGGGLSWDSSFERRGRLSGGGGVEARVGESDYEDRVDRVARSILGVGRKSPPKNFSGGGDGGRRRDVKARLCEVGVERISYLRKGRKTKPKRAKPDTNGRSRKKVTKFQVQAEV